MIGGAISADLGPVGGRLQLYSWVVHYGTLGATGETSNWNSSFPGHFFSKQVCDLL